MKILKFGGSSVKDSAKIQNTINIIKKQLGNDENCAVIVSALGGTTDALLGLINKASKNEDYLNDFNNLKNRHLECLKELKINDNSLENIIDSTFKDLENKLNGIKLLKEKTLKTIDSIISIGEILSANIVSATLRSQGSNSSTLDTREVIVTDNTFGNAKVNFKVSYSLIKDFFNSHNGIVIVTGFIAKNAEKETTTLGRDGSDYTASLIGAALDAKEIEIWTDVDGLYTADPSIVNKAFPQSEISFSEAMELSHFGAKVIYPPAIQPASNKNIPIVIKNSLNPEGKGTVVSSNTKDIRDTICGISSINDISLMRLEGSGMVGIAGISKRIFSALANKNISVILITQASSEHTICFATKPEEANLSKQVIDEEFELEIETNKIQPLIIENDKSIISIVGENMRSCPGMAGKMFSALGKNGVNLAAIAQGSSELSISGVIDKSDVKKGLKALHEEFFFPDNKTINVFLIGTGLIGKALLSQIKKHAQVLEKQSHYIRVTGVANSRYMKLDSNGLDLDSIENGEDSDAQPANLDEYISKIKDIGLPNSVVVDCTASESVVEKYLEILRSNISIITPNKKAQTAHANTYSDLKAAASKRDIHFIYETSVGAGLPVISTLNDLLKSGDRVIKLEGVLSGTLSFIFNSFTGEKTFSEIVSEAREKGFTEPDPRDDLNGIDVARKILILSRESGYDFEIDDIDVENLVPENCRDTKDIEEFFSLLKTHDSYFQDKLNSAKQDNCKLCYMAVLEDGKAKVRLESISSDHPFYNLSGSDNIISFTTERYLERPLVVKGPGAGAQVTAAGVFADIIRIAS